MAGVFGSPAKIKTNLHQFLIYDIHGWVLLLSFFCFFVANHQWHSVTLCPDDAPDFPVQEKLANVSRLRLGSWLGETVTWEKSERIHVTIKKMSARFENRLGRIQVLINFLVQVQLGCGCQCPCMIVYPHTPAFFNCQYSSWIWMSKRLTEIFYLPVYAQTVTATRRSDLDWHQKGKTVVGRHSDSWTWSSIEQMVMMLKKSNKLAQMTRERKHKSANLNLNHHHSSFSFSSSLFLW